MQRLWAPWRIEFIEELRDKAGGCVFCELPAASEDKKNLILYRGRLCYVLMNRYPYNNGHLLILPYKHTGKPSDLTKEEWAEMMEFSTKAMEIMSEALECEGFNCGLNIGKVAGAGIEDHIHIHVVPRWCGDNNFMPIISGTRSMPEYLEATYDRLIKHFEKL